MACAFNCPCNTKINKIKEQIFNSRGDEYATEKAKLNEKFSFMKHLIVFLISAGKFVVIPTVVVASLQMFLVVLTLMLPNNIMFNIACLILCCNISMTLYQTYGKQFVKGVVEKLGNEVYEQYYDFFIQHLTLLKMKVKCCKCVEEKAQCSLCNLNLKQAGKLVILCLIIMVVSKFLPLSFFVIAINILVDFFCVIQKLNVNPKFIEKWNQTFKKAPVPEPIEQPIEEEIAKKDD